MKKEIEIKNLLLQLWHETCYMSSPQDMTETSSFKRLVQIGKEKVTPYLVDQIKKESGWCYIQLFAKFYPKWRVTPKNRGYFREVTQELLEYADKL